MAPEQIMPGDCSPSVTGRGLGIGLPLILPAAPARVFRAPRGAVNGALTGFSLHIRERLSAAPIESGRDTRGCTAERIVTRRSRLGSAVEAPESDPRWSVHQVLPGAVFVPTERSTRLPLVRRRTCSAPGREKIAGQTENSRSREAWRPRDLRTTQWTQGEMGRSLVDPSRPNTAPKVSIAALARSGKNAREPIAKPPQSQCASPLGEAMSPTGVEPVTFSLGNRRSILLSYGDRLCRDDFHRLPRQPDAASVSRPPRPRA